MAFKECYALEKVHGTSASVSWKRNPSNETQYQLVFFSGGTKHDLFVSLFDKNKLIENFKSIGITDRDITIYGESYGGKEQRMGETYGKSPKFVAFDVQIGNSFLDVPKAEKVVKDLGLEFVYYVKISTDLPDIDAERDAPSVQAIRNGITIVNPDGSLTNPKIREGIVLRPPFEVTLNNGERICAKHKRPEFSERKTEQKVDDPEKLKLFTEASEIADEWVVPMRLEHVLQRIPDHSMEQMSKIISFMVEDVFREADGEIVVNEHVKKAIARKTALIYKDHLKSKLTA